MPATFPGFGPQALPFLRALGFHQDRGWYEANRAIYEAELRAPLEALLLDLTGRLGDEGLPLRGDARSIFRLHRDVRFAKDKRPYKTNAGAVMTRDGTKKAQGLLYLHIDPEGCFAAAGFHRPEPDGLGALRRRVAERPDAFRAAVASLAEAGLALGDGDPVSRAPKGFEAVDAADLAPVVRMRSFVVSRPIPDETLGRSDLPERLVAFARAAEPLLRFGWGALDEPPPPGIDEGDGRRRRPRGR